MNYPKSNVKKAVKKYFSVSHSKIGKKSDVLVWTSYLLMMQKLAQTAQNQAREEKTAIVSATHINKVYKTVLASCKG